MQFDIGIIRQEVLSGAYTVEQHSAFCFTKLNRDFLKLSDRIFDIGWKVVDEGPQIGDHGRHFTRRGIVSDVSRILYASSGRNGFHFALDF